MTNELERTIIDLVATDRMYRPSSSFDGKLERARPKIAKAVKSYEGFNGSFSGDRAYARLETENLQKARGIRNGVDEFSQRYPQYGKILNGIIEEKREKSETHLYFGMQEGKRVTHQDYMSVLEGMGMPSGTAERYYEVAIDIARHLQKNNDEERSVLIKD